MISVFVLKGCIYCCNTHLFCDHFYIDFIYTTKEQFVFNVIFFVIPCMVYFVLIDFFRNLSVFKLNCGF